MALKRNNFIWVKSTAVYLADTAAIGGFNKIIHIENVS